MLVRDELEEAPVVVLGTVAALHRYPVKSMAGESLETAVVDRRGVLGDRWWGVVDADGGIGSGKTTRRFRRMDGLLELSAVLGAAGPVVRFPDGGEVAGDDPAVHAALTSYVGRPVALAAEGAVPHHDEGPLHLVTDATVATLTAAHGSPVHPAHLRANLEVSVSGGTGRVEDGWIGRRLRLGDDVLVDVREPMQRCRMVDLAQHDLPAAPGLLRSLARDGDPTCGVVLDVVIGGRLRVGDPVRLASIGA